MASSDVVLKKINALPGQLQKAQTPALRAAGVAGARAMQNVPGAPHKVAGRPQRVSSRMINDSTVSMKWTKGAVLVDQPTKAHKIAPRRRGRRAIGIPGVGPRASAQHPGTRGKGFVRRGKQTGRTAAVKVYKEKQLTAPMKQVFGG